MASSKILLTDFVGAFTISVVLLLSPPWKEAYPQDSSTAIPVVQKKKLPEINNDSAIKAIFDTMSVKLDKFDKKTDTLEAGNRYIRKGYVKVKETRILASEALNKLKYDSLSKVDAAKVDPLKKNDSVSLESNLSLPSVDAPSESKKGILYKLFHKRK